MLTWDKVFKKLRNKGEGQGQGGSESDTRHWLDMWGEEENWWVAEGAAGVCAVLLWQVAHSSVCVQGPIPGLDVQLQLCEPSEIWGWKEKVVLLDPSQKTTP